MSFCSRCEKFCRHFVDCAAVPAHIIIMIIVSGTEDDEGVSVFVPNRFEQSPMKIPSHCHPAQLHRLFKFAELRIPKAIPQASCSPTVMMKRLAFFNDDDGGFEFW